MLEVVTFRQSAHLEVKKKFVALYFIDTFIIADERSWPTGDYKAIIMNHRSRFQSTKIILSEFLPQTATNKELLTRK